MDLLLFVRNHFSASSNPPPAVAHLQADNADDNSKLEFSGFIQDSRPSRDDGPTGHWGATMSLCFTLCFSVCRVTSLCRHVILSICSRKYFHHFHYLFFLRHLNI